MREIVLVRHGETAGESSIRLNGITDVPLSDLGREQMRRVASQLATEEYQAAVASSLIRSQQSLEIALGGDGPHPRIIDDFKEVDFGRWETLTWAEAAALDPEIYRQCKASADPSFRFPGGDSRAGFYARVEAAAHRELGAARHMAARTLCALHKGVTKIIIATLCRLTWDEYRSLPCDLGSIHRIRNDGDRWRLIESNATAHLGETWLQDHPPKG